jgi:group II intron reverse transcriptase/maturase
MNQAWRRIRANGGSPGVDGVTVDEFPAWMAERRDAVLRALGEGTYEPSPVLRVEIPKHDGGTRTLGVPTVLDRVIQQAIVIVLTPLLDPRFSESSHGYRPGRSAHQAVQRARDFVAEGHRWVVDIDLERFFDRVNHDVLMERLSRRIRDKALLRLIRRFLRSGMMAGGLVGARTEGTPQGGPLSPLLSNVLLDEWDKELERRGHCFVRYADDCNIYVRSKRAGDRVLASCRRFLAERLRLQVNAEKSAVDRPWKRSFLGYSVTNGERPRLRIAPKSIQRMKQRVRELTRRTRGVSLKQVIADVATYLRGWLSYYRLAETPSVLRGLDAWLRRKLRCYVIKQKGRNSRFYGLLKSLGVRAADIGWIATSSRGPWRMSRNPQVHTGLSARYFEERGLFSLHRQWSMLVKTT